MKRELLLYQNNEVGEATWEGCEVSLVKCGVVPRLPGGEQGKV